MTTGRSVTRRGVGSSGWSLLAGLAVLSLLVVPQSGAADYIGGGQSADVNAFLNPEVVTIRNGFGQELLRVPIVQAVTLVPDSGDGSAITGELEFKFGPTADSTTFEAFLGKLMLATEPIDVNDTRAGIRVLNIPIGPARNTIVASVIGIKAGTRNAPGKDSDHITLICCVAATEQAPVANAGPDQNVPASSTVTLDGSGSSDANGDALTYAWEQVSGPPVTLSSASAAMPTFRAPVTDVNVDLEFNLAVSDGIWTSFADRVKITVQAGINQPPVVNIVPANQIVQEPVVVTMDGCSSFDPEGSSLAFLWSQTCGTSVTLSNPSGCLTTFDAPPVAAQENLCFHLMATDQLGVSNTPDTGNTTITVLPRNHAPTANAGPDQTVFGPTGVTLDGSASSDPDPGDTITYLWAQTGGPAVTLLSPTSVITGFLAPAVSVDTLFTFRLTVTDSHGLSSFDDVVITDRFNPGTVALTGLSTVSPVTIRRTIR